MMRKVHYSTLETHHADTVDSLPKRFIFLAMHHENVCTELTLMVHSNLIKVTALNKQSGDVHQSDDGTTSVLRHTSSRRKASPGVLQFSLAISAMDFFNKHVTDRCKTSASSPNAHSLAIGKLQPYKGRQQRL